MTQKGQGARKMNGSHRVGKAGEREREGRAL